VKSETDKDFPQDGHLLEKLCMQSFIDLSLIIFLITFPQFPHTMSTIKTNDNSECNISDFCTNTVTCVKQI